MDHHEEARRDYDFAEFARVISTRSATEIAEFIDDLMPEDATILEIAMAMHSRSVDDRLASRGLRLTSKPNLEDTPF